MRIRGSKLSGHEGLWNARKFKILTILKVFKRENRDLWGLSAISIAAMTGLSYGTVESGLSRWMRFRRPYVQRVRITHEYYYCINNKGLRWLRTAEKHLATVPDLTRELEDWQANYLPLIRKAIADNGRWMPASEINILIRQYQREQNT